MKMSGTYCCVFLIKHLQGARHSADHVNDTRRVCPHAQHLINLVHWFVTAAGRQTQHRPRQRCSTRPRRISSEACSRASLSSCTPLISTTWTRPPSASASPTLSRANRPARPTLSRENRPALPTPARANRAAAATLSRLRSQPAVAVAAVAVPLTHGSAARTEAPSATAVGRSGRCAHDNRDTACRTAEMSMCYSCFLSRGASVSAPSEQPRALSRGALLSAPSEQPHARSRGASRSARGELRVGLAASRSLPLICEVRPLAEGQVAVGVGTRRRGCMSAWLSVLTRVEGVA